MIQPNDPVPGPRKRGRKSKPCRDSTGKYINGLRQRSDGRWVIVETARPSPSRMSDLPERLSRSDRSCHDTDQTRCCRLDLSPRLDRTATRAILE